MEQVAPIWLQEGPAKFQVGPAFFRPQARMARDLGILAATVYRQQTGHLRVLDSMAGCGIRALRYALESQADFVWANDSDPDIHPVLSQNLNQNLTHDRYRLTNWDANRTFCNCYAEQDFYDLIDLDCFGSPGPYLGSCLWGVAIEGLLYLTSTDGRSLSGHDSESALATYGAYTRVHPAVQEQGLRVLIGQVQQLAAAKGLGIEPLFSFYARNTYRVMLRLVRRARLEAHQYGFSGYCHACGNYQTIDWRKLGRSPCETCGQPTILSGPLWLAQLHDANFLRQMNQIAQEWSWAEAESLLQVMAIEADMPPYFFTLGEIGRRGKLDIPQRSHLIQQLQDMGYKASVTHITQEAIKTTASLQTCIAIAQAHP